MTRPPSDARARTDLNRPSWRTVQGSYAVTAALLFALWGASRPLLAAVALLTVGTLIFAARRALWLGRCLARCREFSVDLPGSVRVTVARPCPDGSC